METGFSLQCLAFQPSLSPPAPPEKGHLKVNMVTTRINIGVFEQSEG